MMFSRRSLRLRSRPVEPGIQSHVFRQVSGNQRQAPQSDRSAETADTAADGPAAGAMPVPHVEERHRRIALFGVRQRIWSHPAMAAAARVSIERKWRYTGAVETPASLATRRAVSAATPSFSITWMAA